MRPRLLLLAIASTIAISAPAQARHSRTAQSGSVTRYCGDRVCPSYGKVADRPVRGRHAVSQVPHHRVEAYRRHHEGHRERIIATRPSVGESGSGIVHSSKTGAIAHVAARYAGMFQAYINDLEQNYGAVVKFIGGLRRGRCSPGSQHPCGKALDVCQLSRDQVDGRCHLPGRSTLIAVASKHGLQEGGQWCHGDMGHAQVSPSAGPCGSQMMARSHMRRRHHVRYARR